MKRATRKCGARRLGSVALLLVLAACGAKSGLIDDPRPDPGLDAGADVECIDDIDCDDGVFCNGPERCVEHECRAARADAEPSCDDADECTDDACDPVRDECVHTSNVVDADGDGFPSQPCGPDCDDEDPRIFPGALERCNGKDDDCDDLVDEGLFFEPSGTELRLTVDEASSSHGGIAWSGEEYGISYWDYRNGDADIYFQRLDGVGSEVGEEFNVTVTSGDAYGANVLWEEDEAGYGEFGLAWEDRRDSDFEIYFLRMSRDGQKLMADRRISYGAGFSINPDLAWNPDDRQWAIVWEDQRHAGDQGDDLDNFEVYFSRVGTDGVRIPPAGSDQPEVRLTFDGAESESPRIVWAGDEWGVVWNEKRDGNWEIYFRRLGLDGTSLAPEVRVTADDASSLNPTLAWSGTEYAIAWMDDRDGNEEIYWTHFGKDDAPVERPVTTDGAHSRYPSLLWSGSVWLLGWSDFRDGNYEIYYAVFDEVGARIGGDRRLTNHAEDSVWPTFATAGGDIGVLWNDWRDQNWEVYFTELLCSGDG